MRGPECSQLLGVGFRGLWYSLKVRFCLVGGSSPAIIMEDNQRCQV